jgi:hypothetical protein
MARLAGFKNITHLVMLGARGELGHVTEQHTFQVDPQLTRQFAAYSVRLLRDYLADIDNHRYRVGLIYQSSTPKAWGTETLRLTDALAHMLYPVSGASSNELTGFQRKQLENSVFHGMELLMEYTLKDSPAMPVFVPVLFDRGTVLGDYAASLGNSLAAEDPSAPVIEVLNLVGPASSSRDNMEALRTLKEHVYGAFVKKGARKELDLQYVGGSASSGFAATHHASASSISIPLIPRATSPQWYNTALEDVTSEKMHKYLVQPLQCAELEQIRQFARFSVLTPAQQQELAVTCPLYSAPSGSTLLERGSTGYWNLYLLQGVVQLTAADGEERTLEGETDNARNAVAALKPRKFTVTSQSTVSFLWVHDNIVDAIQQH